MSKTTICFQKDCEFRKRNGKCSCKIVVIDENGKYKNYTSETPVDEVVLQMSVDDVF